jgi:hypothetical protein
MLHIINTLPKILDFIPGILLGFFFTAQEDLEKHSLKMSIKFIKNIFIVILFFILTLFFEYGKNFVLFICFIIWFILMYLEKVYLKYI